MTPKEGLPWWSRSHMSQLKKDPTYHTKDQRSCVPSKQMLFLKKKKIMTPKEIDHHTLLVE